MRSMPPRSFPSPRGDRRLREADSNRYQGDSKEVRFSSDTEVRVWPELPARSSSVSQGGGHDDARGQGRFAARCSPRGDRRGRRQKGRRLDPRAGHPPRIAAPPFFFLKLEEKRKKHSNPPPLAL